MLLDAYYVSRLIFQINYPNAFELWDRAGTLSRKLVKIWPGLEATGDIAPSSITFRSKGVQITTALGQGTIVLVNPKTIDALSISRISDTFLAWREILELEELTRVSTRIIYARDFPDIKSANMELMRLLGEKMPQKVFNQDEFSDLNAIEKRWRLLDERSFTNITIRTDELKFELQNEANIEEWDRDPFLVHRLTIDFDRGLKKTPSPDKLRADDWVKGVVHVVRRDIEKIL